MLGIWWGSLRTKIIAWSFVPTMIILVVVAVVILYAYQDVTEDLVIERNQELTRLTAGQFTAELKEYAGLLDAEARRSDVYGNDPVAQHDALKGASRRLAVFDGGVLILDTFGTVVAAEPERPEILGQNWSDRAYYRQILRSQILGSPGPVFSDIVADGPGDAKVIVVAVPITGPQGEFVGTIAGLFRVGAMTVSAFYGDIVKLRLGESGSAYLVDGNGRVVYHTDTDRITDDVSAHEIVQQVLSGQVGAIRTRDFEGQDIVASFAPAPGTSWGLVTQESWATLTRSSRGYGQFLLLLLALGVVVPVLVVTVGVRRITRPIAELIGAAQEVARGNFGQTITARTGDEIEELAGQFNLMSAQLQESYAHLEQRVAERTKELAALNAIAQTVSRSLELEAMLTATLDKVLEVLGFESGAIYLRDLKTGELFMACHRGLSAMFRRVVAKGIISARTAESGHPIIIDDLPKEPDAPKEVVGEGYRSVASIPLLSKGQLHGVLTAASRQLHRFRQEDVDLLLSIGHQIGVAIENARLFEAEQRRAEQFRVIKEAAEEARRAAEVANEAKSAFLANMSHELRTPLNAILGFSQIMQRDPALPTGQRENLNIINRSGEHLLILINDILEMSKIEAGRITLSENNFDLYRLLADLESMFRLRTRDKSLQLCFERSLDVPQYIRTDEGKLRQVLINLLSNAVKFTEKGAITLRVNADRDRDRESLSPLSISPLYLLFEVEDTGPGIAPEEQDSIFDVFVQAESGRQAQEGGTGLGLPISRQFVQLMGGELTVESPPSIPPSGGEVKGGQGSIFRFDIQISQVAATDVQPTQPARRVIGLEPNQPVYRLLVVDDSVDNRKLLVELLEPLGFEIREANNGQESIEVWERWQPDLIWMDMRMPVMDGYEATRQIKTAPGGQSTVIVALTASAFEEERARVLSTGCDDFVRKPFREAEIFDKLSEHLGVRYLYKDEPLADSNQIGEGDQKPLTAADLVALPLELLADLRQAVKEINLEKANAIIDRIGQRDEPMAQALAELVENFRFDTLQTLVEEAEQ